MTPKDYLHKLTERASSLIDLASNFDTEGIHKLRVTAKKLKMLEGIAETFGDNKNLQIAHQATDKLFKKMGAIRNIQIQEQLLAEYLKQTGMRGTALLKDLKGQEEKLEQHLATWIHQFPQKAFSRLERALKQNLDSAKKRTLKEHSTKFVEKLEKKFEKAWTKNEFHKARTFLKRIYYAEDFLTKALNKRISSKHHHILDDIGHLLGHWHDRIILADSIQNFRLHTAGNMRGYELIEERVRKDANSFLEQAKAMIK